MTIYWRKNLNYICDIPNELLWYLNWYVQDILSSSSPPPSPHVKSTKKYLMSSRVKEKAQFPSCPILDCVYLYFHTLLSGILFLCQRLLYQYFVSLNECQLMFKSLNDVFCFYNFLLELINSKKYSSWNKIFWDKRTIHYLH